MPWEKSSADLVRLFQQIVPAGPGITQRKMFGCLCAFVNGNFFIGIFQQSLMFHLGPADQAAFLEQPGTGFFEPFPGKPSKKTVVLNDPFSVSDSELANWIQCAFGFAARMPPKQPKPAKAKKAARK